MLGEVKQLVESPQKWSFVRSADTLLIGVLDAVGALCHKPG